MLRRTSSFTSCGVPLGSTPWVSTPPPQKISSVAKFPLQLDRVHAGGRGLHRVEYVHTYLDEVGDQRAHIAIGMEEAFGVRGQLAPAAQKSGARAASTACGTWPGEINCEYCVP